MSAGGSPSQGVDPSAVLDRLDAQLGEVGRRQHRFAWLRDPLSEDWIVVDAYYPGNRVVVFSGEDETAIATCEEHVPRQGLFLVTLSAVELAGDGDALARQLRARLEIQGWERTQQRAVAAPAPPPPAAEPASAPAHPRSSRRRAQHGVGSEGVGVGVTLVGVVVLELIVGGALIGLDAGQYVLGFGFVLDAGARVLGMVVASQRSDLDAAWAAVIFGSPAIWGLKPSPASDLVPVARLTAILAGALVVLGLLIWIV